MQPERISMGDTIGLISPSHIAIRERYAEIIASLEKLGFKVKAGRNLYADPATAEQRADDLNSMVLDDEVKLIFFGGGYGSVDLLPLMDYDAIKKHPKAFLTYSDGTTILNAIYVMTGLSSFYGQTPGNFENADEYTLNHFFGNIVDRNNQVFVKNSPWRILKDGSCEGILIGGYTENFALMLGSRYFSYDKNQKYILFLEDHERFSSVARVSALLSNIEQSDFMNCVSGLIFGHYSENVPDELIDRLTRLCRTWGIPGIYCDDFGHGANHGILPLGSKGRFNTEECELKLFYEEER